MADLYSYVGSYRLGEGEIALGDFDSSYEIGAFPRQDDQPNILDWVDPLVGSDIVEEIEAVIDSMDGTAGTWGATNFEWFSAYWTPLMVRYFLDRFFPNGAGSIRVTVMTFDRSRGYVVYWATMKRPRLKDAEAVGDGYKNIRLSFIDAVLIEA